MSFLKRFLGRKADTDAEAAKRAALTSTKEQPEPATGHRRALSPLGIIATEVMADSGNLSLAADLCHAFTGDARVQAALSQRVGGLLSLPLSWEDGAKKSARVKKAIEDDFYEGIQESSLFSLYSWGIILGVGLGEILWKVGQSGRVIPTLKVWDPRWLSYDSDKGEWAADTADGTKVTVNPGDGHWVLYTPRGSRNPWRNGLWRSLNKPFFVKDDASLNWARFNEVYGSPLRVATGTQGMSKKQLDAIADSVDTSKGFTSAAIPYGSKLEIVEATGSTWSTFQSAIQWAAEEISIAILGQNLTTQVDGGSLAASKTHRAVEEMLIQSDAESESTFLREQILSWWALYNFGDMALAPWPRRELDEPEDLTASAALFKECGDAVLSLKAAGFQVDLEAMAEKFGIPLNPAGAAEAGESTVGTDTTIPDETEDVDVGEAENSGAERGLNKQKDNETEKIPDEASSGVVWMAAKQGTALKNDLPKGADTGFDRIDAMADRAEKQADPDIEDQSDIIQRAIEEATDEDDLGKRLEAAFVGMESGELNSLLERALILADIEGRWSVMEDV